MSQSFNKHFYRTWEFYLFLISILQAIFAALNGLFGFSHILQLGLGFYVGYLAFFKPRSWIKKTWQLYLVASFILGLSIVYFFLL